VKTCKHLEHKLAKSVNRDHLVFIAGATSFAVQLLSEFALKFATSLGSRLAIRSGPTASS
jgi:hypothetical protein